MVTGLPCVTPSISVFVRTKVRARWMTRRRVGLLVLQPQAMFGPGENVLWLLLVQTLYSVCEYGVSVVVMSCGVQPVIWVKLTEAPAPVITVSVVLPKASPAVSLWLRVIASVRCQIADSLAAQPHARVGPEISPKEMLLLAVHFACSTRM